MGEKTMGKQHRIKRGANEETFPRAIYTAKKQPPLASTSRSRDSYIKSGKTFGNFTRQKIDMGTVFKIQT